MPPEFVDIADTRRFIMTSTIGIEPAKRGRVIP